MTWAKTAPNFPDDLADREVSDSLYRVHHEVLCHLYSLEKASCRFKRSRLTNITNSPNARDAADEAVRLGLWTFHADDGEYEVLHHADVVRQSLAAQWKARDQNARDQQRKRDRDAARRAQQSGTSSGTDAVPASGETQSINQTSIHRETTEQHEVHNGTVWRITGEPVS